MKILYIEDDQHTSELLSATLSEHRYAVDAIADGSVGLELATRWSYDLILLDIVLPTLNGIEVCRRLRAQGCQIPILMLTAKDSNDDIIAGLDAGADDYVAKSCDPSQLLARVRALMRRGSTASSPVLTWGSLCFDPASARVTYNQQEITLRPKEHSLLELFLRHPQRIFNRGAIIDHLWSMEETPVEGSVTNLIKDLRQRLKASGMTADLIETVYGLGYRLKPTPQPEEKASEGKSVEPAPDRRLASEPLLTEDLPPDWSIREQRGMTAIQHIKERFWASLEQRIALLEAAERSLQSGTLTVQQQTIARKEAHKLVGAFGTFGYVNVSTLAQDIEHLLASNVGQDPQCAHSFSRLLNELKQELALPSAPELMANSAVVRK